MPATKGRGHQSYLHAVLRTSVFLSVCPLVANMTAQSDLAAFERFIARRDRVLDLWSDNGTKFVGGANELKKPLFSAEVLLDKLN